VHVLRKAKSSWAWWAALAVLVFLITMRVVELARSGTRGAKLPQPARAEAGGQPTQPGHPEAQAKKTPPTQSAPVEQAEAMYEDAAGTVADLLWVKSEAYFHTEHYDDVIDLAKAVVNLDPGYVDAWLGAAWLLWSDEEKDRDPEALEMYRMAMEHNPRAWEIPFDIGFLYYNTHMRDPKTGLPYIQKAAELAPLPDKVKVLKTLGHIQRKLGRTKEALETFREVLKIAPDDAPAKTQVERLRGLVEK